MSTLGSLYGHSSPSIPRSRLAQPQAQPTSPSQPSMTAAAAAAAAAPPPKKRLHVPLVGLRRSGKTSMLNVVCNDLHPDDTLFLESTTRPSSVQLDAFLPLTITDMPGGILLGGAKLENGLPLLPARIGPPIPNRGPSPAPGPGSAPRAGQDLLLPWTDVSAVVFVIDAQDDYFEALSKLHSLILSAFAQNQTIEFHVFIHKIDGYSDDYRQETLADVRGKVLDDLVDSSPSFVAQPWSYPASSTPAPPKEPPSTRFKSGAGAGAGAGGITSEGGGYDASASEISVASIEPGQVNLETAVNLHFHLTSIFDTSVFVAFSKIHYSLMQRSKPTLPAPAPAPALGTLGTLGTLAESVETLCDSILTSSHLEKVFLFDLPTRTYVGTDSSPFDPASFDVIFEYAGFLSKFAALYANLPPASRYASSVARLGPDTSLAFWQMNQRLALIAILKTEVHATQGGLIDYNVCFFRKAVERLYVLGQHV